MNPLSGSFTTNVSRQMRGEERLQPVNAVDSSPLNRIHYTLYLFSNYLPGVYHSASNPVAYGMNRNFPVDSS
jgi:hypothetical protein